VISVLSALDRGLVCASAPCRIDAGGTWDIKGMALLFEAVGPITLNIALSLRTKVVLSPYREGWIRVRSQGFGRGASFPVDRISYRSRFGLLLGALTYFGYHGISVDVHSEVPPRSSLGGSSVALVALIKALDAISVGLGSRAPLRRRDILHLAYHLEDAVAGGGCGMQDHAAAVYGGVHAWSWHYGRESAPLEGLPLLDARGRHALSRRILVAYSGIPHSSGKTNRRWVSGFLSGKTRALWLEANAVVRELAEALGRQDWDQAVGLLREEMRIRRIVTPEAFHPVAEALINEAEAMGCAARFAGAGAGGSVWALGQPLELSRLRERWREALSAIPGARLFACRVDSGGVRRDRGNLLSS